MGTRTERISMIMDIMNIN